MKRTDIRVDKYSTVVINKVHYSVPDTYVGKKLDARIYAEYVEIYNKGELIAKHERHYNQGEYVLNILVVSPLWCQVAYSRPNQ